MPLRRPSETYPMSQPGPLFHIFEARSWDADLLFCQSEVGAIELRSRVNASHQGKLEREKIWVSSHKIKRNYDVFY
jgi:hypothetical protein